MNADEQLSKILRLLQGSIRAGGFTQTEIDERIGRRRGYLSHVFQRRVDLKVVDLLHALAVLGLDPGRFFDAALGSRPEGRSSLEDLMQLVAHRQEVEAEAGNGARPAPGAGEPPVEPRLMARVRAAVRSILAQESRGPGAIAGRGAGAH
jgi:hypothetical protein